MLLRLSRLLVLLLVVIAASTGQAATASLSGGDPPVSGISVSDVDYTLATERPDLLIGVSFPVATSQVERLRVRLSADGEWSSCAVAAGTAECRLASPVPVAAATELAVSAA